jgi:hypothetical protein
MHGAKGLEFDAVFLPDVIEGNIPHRKSVSGDALEEERRLLYVAMTRARRHLWIGWIRRDRAGKCSPSRFLRLIGQKALVKTAVIVDISRVTAVLSCFREDTGWTKRVGKNVGNRRFIRGK